MRARARVGTTKAGARGHVRAPRDKMFPALTARAREAPASVSALNAALSKQLLCTAHRGSQTLRKVKQKSEICVLSISRHAAYMCTCLNYLVGLRYRV